VEGALPEASDKEECFVIMPIAERDDYGPTHFADVYKHVIKPAVEAAGLRCIRADEVHRANLIHLDILHRIVNAKLAICDLSGLNPNVMFELGIRQAFDKPVVLIKDDRTRSPFDISPLRHQEYDAALSYKGVLAAQAVLTKAVESMLTEGAASDVNSIVRLMGLVAASEKLSEASPVDAKLELMQKSIDTLTGSLDRVLHREAASNRRFAGTVSSDRTFQDVMIKMFNETALKDPKEIADAIEATKINLSTSTHILPKSNPRK
jgi:hypothetical protein